MGEIVIKKVKTKQEFEQFIQLYYNLYKGSKFAVPYLRKDEGYWLDDKDNPAFRFCEAAYYLAIEDGTVIGRVAAIINHRYNQVHGKKQVRFGWFDVVDNISATKLLLKAVEDFGKQRGMTEMIGPMGYTDKDRQGMLIEGFNHLGKQFTNYNYAYYPEHLKTLFGFKKEPERLEFRLKIQPETSPRFLNIRNLVAEKYHLKAVKLNKKNLKHGTYARDIYNLLESEYDGFFGYHEISEARLAKLVKHYVKKFDLNLLTAVADENDHIISLGVAVPSFSKALQKTNEGRLLPWGWLELFKSIMQHETDTVEMLVLTTDPKYRAKGVESLIVTELLDWFRKYKFTWVETSPVEKDSNIANFIWSNKDAEVYRIRRLYTKDIRDKDTKYETTSDTAYLGK